MAVPLSVHPKLPRRLPLSLGFSRYSLLFNGLNQYVLVPNAASLQFAHTATMGAWFRADSLHAGVIIVRGAGVGNTQYIIVDALGNVIGGIHDSGGWGFGPLGTYVPGEWHHACWTYEGLVAFRGYYDDVLAFDIPIPARDNLVGPLADVDIGINFDEALEPFDGLIDEPFIYDVALTGHQVRRNILDYHNLLNTGLVLSLRFEEGAGIIAYDESGYGNNGSLLPALAPPTWRRNRKWELRAEVGL